MHLGKRNADRVIQMEGTRLLAYVNKRMLKVFFYFIGEQRDVWCRER